MRKIIATALITLGILGGAAFGFDAAFTTGVASHDLKKNVVTSTLTNVSGVRTLSVTCPDGGVALSKGVEAPITDDPLYYHMSEVLSESGHVVSASLGSDWTDNSTFTATLTATCVSLSS